MTKMHPKDDKYITLITGASKTADIERVLAIGVHGPERLVIVCVDDLRVRRSSIMKHEMSRIHPQSP